MKSSFDDDEQLKTKQTNLETNKESALLASADDCAGKADHISWH